MTAATNALFAVITLLSSINNLGVPFLVCAMPFTSNISPTSTLRSTCALNSTLEADSVVAIEKVILSPKGTPRLKTDSDTFITANKSFVQAIN